MVALKTAKAIRGGLRRSSSRRLSRTDKMRNTHLARDAPVPLETTVATPLDHRPNHTIYTQ